MAAWRMSTETVCAGPPRCVWSCAAASPAAAIAACAAVPTRNEEGSAGSLPVSVTLPRAAGSPPVWLQRSARISAGDLVMPAEYRRHTTSDRAPPAHQRVAASRSQLLGLKVVGAQRAIIATGLQ